MGTLIRVFEDRMERGLAARKSKGVIPPQEPRAAAAPARHTGAASDLRSQVPVMGLREYWYPALPESKVGKKPLFWTMLGDEMVFFRDKSGNVVALTDVCPHRGASLSEGASYYRGFVTCPYHGATFDGKGECAAFLCEGPDSRMVGRLKAKTYPTRVLGGWVFIWMGEGEPAPIEEDVAPEMFDPDILPLTSYTYWFTNWLLAIENHSDSHNALFVHRDSIRQLLGWTKGRNRSPIGPRNKVIEGRALAAIYDNQEYYAKDGKVPYQMYYPGVDGLWPLHRWRLLWQRFFKPFASKRSYGNVPEEWRIGHHLPSMVRTGGVNTRYAVAVEPNISRIIYFYFVRRGSVSQSVWEKLHFNLIHQPLEYNFSNQDNGAASPCRFWMPERLSATDAQVVKLRSLIVNESRDAVRRRGGDQTGQPPEAPAQPIASPEPEVVGSAGARV